MMKQIDVPCSHLRFDGKEYGCAVLGECKPIQAGPDLTGCPSFHNHHHLRKQPQPAKAPVIEATLRCVNLGEWTRELRKCDSCGDGSDAKVFECSLYERCTVGVKVNGKVKGRAKGLACCSECPSFQSATPSRIVRIALPGHYNCSAMEWDGKVLMASRLDSKKGSSIWLSELGEDLQPLWSYPLQTIYQGRTLTAEDPRMFARRGRPHVSFTTYDGKVADVAVASLCPHTLQVDSIWFPEYPQRTAWEKNWLFFEERGDLFSLYSVTPHLVLRHDGHKASTAYKMPHGFLWPQHHMRGGALAKSGDLYWHWMHGVKTVDDHHFYSVGLYAFSARPPFRPVKCVPGPVLIPNERDRPLGLNKSVAFPCGAVLRNGRWHVSFGYHDRECRVAIFDAGEIEKAMVKL